MIIVTPQFTVAFRTDASVRIGTGHVMRCLSLADALRARGAACLFLCRPHDGHLLALIAGRGHQAVALPALDKDQPQSAAASKYAYWLGTDQETDALHTRAALGAAIVDWLVVDHYSLDVRWEQALRPHCDRLMVIDDLADRRHDCDLLLDQNLGRVATHYNELLPEGTTAMIGPHYALLQPAFAHLREASLQRRAHPQLQRMLITMGGVDQDNITSRVLDALLQCQLPDELTITVIMGPHAPWLYQVQTQALQMPWPTRVLAGVDNMAQLMAESDLSIGAAGSTSWERCCMGLPTVQLVLADNQEDVAAALAQLGAVESVRSNAGLPEQLRDLFRRLNADTLMTLSQRAAMVCDGKGTPVVVDALMKTVDNYEIHR